MFGRLGFGKAISGIGHVPNKMVDAVPLIKGGGSYGGMASRTINSQMARKMVRWEGSTAAKTAGKTSRSFRGRGAMVAGVVAGGLAINGMRGRSGRAADKVTGRPTGIYGF